MKRDREVGADDGSCDLTRGGIHARGEVDRDDGNACGVDPLDQRRRIRPGRAVKAGPEERVDEDVVPVYVLRFLGDEARLAEHSGGDASVTAVRAPPADASEPASVRKREHRLPRHGRPRALHELGDGARVVGIALLHGAHLGCGVELLEQPQPRGLTTHTAAAISRECVNERSIAPAATRSAKAAVRPDSRTPGLGRPTISTSRHVKRTPQPSALPTASLPAKRAA